MIVHQIQMPLWRDIQDHFLPLDHEDHPELRDTPLCGPDDIATSSSLWLALVNALQTRSTLNWYFSP